MARRCRIFGKGSEEQKKMDVEIRQSDQAGKKMQPNCTAPTDRSLSNGGISTGPNGLFFFAKQNLICTWRRCDAFKCLPEWMNSRQFTLVKNKWNSFDSIGTCFFVLFFFCKKKWVKLFAEPGFVKTNKQTKKQKKNVADREVIGDYRRKWKPIKWVL